MTSVFAPRTKRDPTGCGHDEQKDAVQRGLHRLGVKVLPWDLQLETTWFSTRDAGSETNSTTDQMEEGIGYMSHLCGPLLL